MEKNNVKKVEEKKVQPKVKKDNVFTRIFKKVKEVFSEIKKVSWPSFSKVVKQTSVVLGVSLLFMVVITLMDLGLGWLLGLLTGIGA